MRRLVVLALVAGLLAAGVSGCDARDDGAFVRDIDSRATPLPWTVTDEQTP